MRGGERLPEGTLFAHDFELLAPLGEGGFGTVYRAVQRSTGAPRAVKVLHASVRLQAEVRDRFVQEAQLSARIASDHVVQVVAAGVDDATGSPWMAMELLEGETLAARLARPPAPKWDEAIELLSQLGHGLAAAHAIGIVHRDLKPENVFVAAPRRAGVPFTAKLLDFGIAKVLTAAKVTRTGAIGTPLWAAPEQMDGQTAISAATDVWALGLLAFQLLTGRSYWLAAQREPVSVPALLKESMHDAVATPSARHVALGGSTPLPVGFDAWFLRCVARDPNARFSDAQAALDGMRSWATAIGAPATAQAPAPGPLAGSSPTRSMLAPLPTSPLGSAAIAKPARTRLISALVVGAVACGLAGAWAAGVFDEARPDRDDASRNAERGNPDADDDTPEQDATGDEVHEGPHGFLTVACTPACDAVRVGGKDHGRSPARIALPPGRQTVMVSREGHKKTFSVEIEAGKTRSVNITMKPTANACGCDPDDLMCEVSCKKKKEPAENPF